MAGSDRKEQRLLEIEARLRRLESKIAQAGYPCDHEGLDLPAAAGDCEADPGPPAVTE